MIKLRGWPAPSYPENDWKCWEVNLAVLTRVSLCFSNLSGIKVLCNPEFYPRVTLLQQTWAIIICTICSPSICWEDSSGNYPRLWIFSRSLSSSVTYQGRFLNPFPQAMGPSFPRSSHMYIFWGLQCWWFAYWNGQLPWKLEKGSTAEYVLLIGSWTGTGNICLSCWILVQERLEGDTGFWSAG